MFEYGSRAGFWRLWRLFTARNIPVTVFGVASALARNPEVVAAMREAGWEIASHGLKWIDYKDFSQADEAAHMREAIRLHTEATGERPFGWYTGRTSEHTLGLVLAEGGFLYSSDSYADDLPYWVRGSKAPHLIIPYTLDANDMRFINPQGFATGDDFFAYLRDSFDFLYSEGERAPKMMSIGLHCRLAGRPGRAAGLDAVFGPCRRLRSGLDRDPPRHRASLVSRAPSRRCCVGDRVGPESFAWNRFRSTPSMPPTAMPSPRRSAR